MKQRILFRSDGNSEIGLGHVIRSLALSKFLIDHFECVFVTRFLNDFISKEALKNSSAVLKLSEKNEDHFEEFLKLIRNTDIVVLDNYFFNTDYQIAIKNIGCTLVCIDDMCDKHYVSDVVINHSPGKVEGDFSRENHTRLCLGLDYVMLREEFFNVEIKRDRKIPKHGLICLGGSDKFDITSKILVLLSQQTNVQTLDVIVGAAYKHLEILKKSIAESVKKINLFTNLSAKEMSLRMQSCDFGVLPASSICLEALSVGLPFIVGYTVANQKQLYETLISDYRVPGVGNFLYLNNFPNIKMTDMPVIEVKDSRERLISVFMNYAI